jgi:PiT family inorganic phosphate transporter
MEAAPVGFWGVALLVALALGFVFLNGFHDAANSIATVVSTGVLRPHQAVVFAAFFNFAAVFVFVQLEVAETVGSGLVAPGAVDAFVVFGALIGAIAWNLLTWWHGIPSSSSHALIGGLIGAVLVKAGPGQLVTAGLLKTLAFIVISPTLGFLLGSLLTVLVAWIARGRSPLRVDNWFRRLQLVSAGLYSLGHGGNDAQKTIGVIWLLLVAGGHLGAAETGPPAWAVLMCYVAIAFGTLFGGWRIVKTMGQKITRLKPSGGFCAETAGALTMFLAAGQGIPISTTQTIAGAIAGAGSTRRLSAVRWGVAGNIVWAWVFTIPASALIAAVFYWVGRGLLTG